MCVFSSVHAGAHESQKRELDPGAGVTAISELPNMGAGTWAPVFTTQQQETQQRSHLFRTQAATEDVSHLSTVTLTARLQASLPKIKFPNTALWGHGKQDSQSDSLKRSQNVTNPSEET